MLHAERERQAVRLRLQHKAQANRFMKAFRAEIADGVRPSESTPRNKQTPQQAVSETNAHETAQFSGVAP